MARPREIPGLGCGTPFREAAAMVVEARAAELLEHGGGVLDPSDVERVHDMRVATRRLRAALELFAPCFPKRRRGAALREVKALADALGARRDPDVQLAALEGYARELPGVDVSSVELALRERQAAANAELETALERLGRVQELLAGLTAETAA